MAKRNHSVTREPKYSLHHLEFTECIPVTGRLLPESRFTIIVSVALVLSRFYEVRKCERVGVTH